MSSSDSGQRAAGPFEKRIDELWQKVREAYDKVEPYEHIADQSASDLASFKTMYQYDQADYRRAESAHNALKAAFKAYQQNVEKFRADNRWVMESLVRQTIDRNAFVAQTLALANGAVALGALAYLGEAHTTENAEGMVITIWLSAGGFFLTLIASHIATLLTQPVVRYFGHLSDPSLPAVKRPELIEKRQRALFWATWPPRIISYLAAVCLLLAVIWGGDALRNKHPSTVTRTPQPSKTNAPQ